MVLAAESYDSDSWYDYTAEDDSIYSDPNTSLVPATRTQTAESAARPVWDQEAWFAHTRRHLNGGKALRMQLRQTQLSDADSIGFLSQYPEQRSAYQASRGGGFGQQTALTTYLENKAKAKRRDEIKIAQECEKRTESIEYSTYNLFEKTKQLQRASAHCWGCLNIAEKRLEVRNQRPEGENFRDYLTEVLEREREELRGMHEKLSQRLSQSKIIKSAIDDAKENLVEHKLTLHLDRSDWPRELLQKIDEIQDEVAKFCAVATKTLETTHKNLDEAKRRTTATIKKRIAETRDLRRHLDREITVISQDISEAEISLDKVRKVIQEKRNAPEAAMGSSFTFDMEALYANTTLDAARMAVLRRKIKAASYTGSGGRQLDILLMRMDRDGSGQLDEDEVRTALRRHLKIPSSIISDPEISALCAALDADDSGSVGINEIVDFLNADVDLEAMEDKWTKGLETVEQLKQHRQVLVENLRRKAKAWAFERECLDITFVKGLELHTMPPAIPKAGASQAAARRQKPLEPRVREKVREKLWQAVREASRNEPGGMMDAEACFSTFDGDGSGQLEIDEVRQALRNSLKIPIYQISDAEIMSLCIFLDKDESGSVGIDELVAFITDTSAKEPRLAKIRKVKSSKWVPKPSVALIEKVRSRLKRSVRDMTKAADGDLDILEALSRFDSDGSGQLDVEEVRRTFRGVLKIGKDVVSDPEISSLCVMLDKDASGSVDIEELAAFMFAADKQGKGTRPATSNVAGGVKLPSSARGPPVDATALHLPPPSRGHDTAR